MTTRARTLPLTGIRLPEDQPLRRDHVRPPERHIPIYLERYDDRTLFYDCVYLPHRGSFLLTAPRFLNLWGPFRAGIRLDGHRVRHLRRRPWLRCEQIEIPGPRGALTLEIGGRHYEIEARDHQAEMFAGLDTVMAVNKNNRFDWIGDWARYLVANHGLQAVVLFDNASTDYAAAELADFLAGIEGLQSVLVYQAPFPYGPSVSKKLTELSPRFFQTSMFNIARRDALDRARAVLSVDIDEIVVARSERSVFDLAARHPLGMVTLHGHWVYPAEDATLPAGHGAHVRHQVPPKKCNRKWCMTPQGAMSRFGWAVHQIGGLAQNLFTNTRQASLLHCKGTSTGWKRKRFEMPPRTREDPDLVRFMARHFPRDGRPGRPLAPGTADEDRRAASP